ncbi:glycosyltransferase [Algoriphagus zhangzhouensis]|uniref:Glycosyltransferase, GT2 family n=1 Tax=Algoriphagus zhangzhouensis TaxID=1073327 RepID=A0A1M7ZKE8_9BACT|nr:glycosyltransferase [Algoriphagus zhangzhouensis]TDY42872.1 GT2 family glycosyltransferase [Algoriphagus zhangzhouensis]SHO65385.1 Glycosyltransferase, GT2 family [Algoriphagus zhangzhouensis]
MTKQTLGVFLTTFERTDCLNIWIDLIKKQTIQPNKILVVDNSESDSVYHYFENKPISYLRVGFNSGPAGAASIGLKKLYEEGYDWIYWGDDDDPPTDPGTFERLLEIGNSSPSTGIVGKVGGRFISNRGRTRVYTNSELKPILVSDYVPGNKHILVSSKVIRHGIVSDPKLFFGFEELEFCLRVKDAGFLILVDGKGMMDARIKAGNLSPGYKWKGKSIGDLSRINRQYYSVRNMLYILWSRGEYLGYFYFLIKSLVKLPFSIKYGFSYFRKLSGLYGTAIFHHLTGRYGQYIATK